MHAIHPRRVPEPQIPYGGNPGDERALFAAWNAARGSLVARIRPRAPGGDGELVRCVVLFTDGDTPVHRLGRAIDENVRATVGGELALVGPFPQLLAERVSLFRQMGAACGDPNWALSTLNPPAGDHVVALLGGFAAWHCAQWRA